MMSMEACVNHANHAAIERCELCGQPLCGLCLWYAEDGRRLCEQDAKQLEAGGVAITHPQVYAEAIELSAPTSFKGQDEAPYRGNRFDLYALVGAMLGGGILANCTGLVYCIPVVALILGGYAYANANQSLNPQRTRLLAGISLTIAGLMFLFFFVILMFFAFSIGMAIISSRSP